MRCYLQQPRVLYFNNLSHKLFCGEYELVVYKPARVVLKYCAVGMYHHCLVLLDRLVLPSFAKFGRVVEETCCDSLQIIKCVHLEDEINGSLIRLQIQRPRKTKQYTDQITFSCLFGLFYSETHITIQVTIIRCRTNRSIRKCHSHMMCVLRCQK